MLLEDAAERPTSFPGVNARPPLNALFSFPAVVALLLMLLMLFTVRGRFNDPDLWWHLKTGEIISRTHHIPRTDTFSFTTNNHAYIPHEWLSQLTMFAAYDSGGYTGLMLWFCTVALFMIGTSYVLCTVYSGNPKVALLGGILVWFFSTIGLSLRPQLLGYVLLSLELLILHLGRSRDCRWFLALPFLFILWVNCHGSFFFGLILLAVTLFCSLRDLRLGMLVCHGYERKRRNVLALASVLSLACLFLNPIGLKQVLYPMDTLFHQTEQMKAVSEWQSTHFDDPRGLALLSVASLILLVPLARRIELEVNELLLVSFGFGLAVLHQRMLFVFGLIAAPVLCRLLATAWDSYQPERDHPVLNAIIISSGLLIGFAAFPSSRELQDQVAKGNPVRAVDFVNRSGLHGNMLNEYVYGGYLIWAAPQHKVFVDGRGDVFEWTGVLRDYAQWANLKSDPNELLDKYHINFCVLARDSPMSRVLPLLAGWEKVYLDESSNIFARSGTLKR
jgi:hypothetical protein